MELSEFSSTPNTQECNKWKQNILVLITVTLYIDSELFIKAVFSKKIFLGHSLKNVGNFSWIFV